MILWAVGNSLEVAIVSAGDREAAKRKAARHLKANPDTFIVTPLTQQGASVHFDVSMTDRH